jgi:DNA-directed RNA polymerase subunit alpha
MAQIVEFDLKQTVLRNDTFGPREVRQMQETIARDFSQYAVLRDAVSELQAHEEHTPASRVRLGIALYLLGRYYRAIESLQQADGGAMAHYYLAKCHFARQEYKEAIESYKAAERAGYDAGDCALGRAEAIRCSGDPQASLALLDSLSGAVEQTAEYLAQRAATVAALAEILARSWPSTSGPSSPTAITPARCSAWPWKTTATATTTRPWNCTSGR